MLVRSKATVVFSLPKTRTNRTETISYWQTKKLVKIIVTCSRGRITLSSKTTSASALEQQ